MKSNDLFDAIGMAKDDYISDAKKPIPKKIYRSKWLYSGIAAVLACAILIGAFAFPKSPWFVGNRWKNEESEQSPTLIEKDPLPQYALSVASYPDCYPFPTQYSSNEEWKMWRESVNALKQDYHDLSINLDNFFAQSIPVFLSGDEEENKIYSPLNVYMALGMLAEITDGNSQAQILDLLGIDNKEQLRKEMNAVWKAHYSNSGADTLILSNSLWLNQNLSYNQDTVDILAKEYYASTFRGEMGSAEYNQALQGWLNQQTDGLLENQISNIKMSPNTMLTLASTVLFRDKWENRFLKSNNDLKTFYASKGEITAEFMNSSRMDTYYWGEQFGAVKLPMIESGNMMLILPDKGVDVKSLLSDAQVMDYIFGGNTWENQKYLMVNLSVPKFDISSQIDLQEGLETLGVTDIFNAAEANFSPIFQNGENAFMTDSNHGTRVVIDEEGCTGAAYTLSTYGAGVPTEDEVDFVLDRPFLFVVTSSLGLPIFVGIVNQPQ